MFSGVLGPGSQFAEIGLGTQVQLTFGALQMPSPPYNLRAQDAAQAQVGKPQNLQQLLVCPGNSRSECSTPQNRQIRDERRSIDGKTIKFIHLQNVGLGHPGSSNTGKY